MKLCFAKVRLNLILAVVRETTVPKPSKDASHEK